MLIIQLCAALNYCVELDVHLKMKCSVSKSRSSSLELTETKLRWARDTRDNFATILGENLLSIFVFELKRQSSVIHKETKIPTDVLGLSQERSPNSLPKVLAR